MTRFRRTTRPSAGGAPERSWGRSGVMRATLLAAVAGGLTIAAGTVEGTVEVARPSERAGLSQTSDVLIESASLVCPGQQRVGTEGMRDVPGTVQVASAGSPDAVLRAISDITGSGAPAGSNAAGRVSLLDAKGSVLASTDRRSRPVATTTTGAAFVVARGERGLAPGLAAVQSWWHTGDDDRGLSVTPCVEPAADVWLLGGGAGASRTERVLVVNPGVNPVSVRVEVFGAEGRVGAADRASVSIPPQSRMSLSLDALAPDELRPAVHVVASGGVVSAVLNDAWIDGATARGVEDATAAAPPARDLVVPAVEAAAAGQGDAVLRIVNPGGAEALVRAMVLTPEGARQPTELRAVRVGADSTVDVPLSLPAGGNALRLTSDRPVTAAVFVDRRQGPGKAAATDREGDFGWAPALPPIRAVAGVVIPAQVPQGATRTLHLAAGPAGGSVTVTLGAGTAERQVTAQLKPLTAVTVPLGDAERVWVTTGAVDVRAAVSVSLSQQGSPYYSIVPVHSAPTTATSVPVRQLTR
ncbi:DUF5719 family protein [Intrasporangium calvum]|uniref:Secreted protein n=1 Tax=Intrasporangium calvum (strain ATCC 23552 / DSM 43043 / JCM 3097 / NBRC 12989 / NCIMB 10167 / NRRL B-3866 / 7 KIP) TaxID=710696 RepID=E6S789_INTC7|nr:DUF5719 family protein [Intrasporangium calvum]ADU49023.1 hypothetical protein Intca_2517 [Intrasporangium calvum DSM 43043]